MLTGLLWVAFFWFVFGRIRRNRWRRHQRLHQISMGSGGPEFLMQRHGRHGPFMHQDRTRVAMPEVRAPEPESPFDALKRRYVADEITVEEYETELDRLYHK